MSTIITIEDAAKLLKISEQRVRTLCRNKDINAKKVGNLWLINASSLNEYGIKTAHLLAKDHPVYQMKRNQPIALSFFLELWG